MRPDLNSIDPQAPTIVMPDFSAFTWSDVITNEINRRGRHGYEGGLKLVLPRQIAQELASHGGFRYTSRAPIYTHQVGTNTCAAGVRPTFEQLNSANVIGIAYELYVSTRDRAPTPSVLAEFQERIKDWMRAKIKEVYQRAIEVQMTLRRNHLVEKYTQTCALMAEELTLQRQEEIRKLQAELDQGKLVAATTEMIVWSDEIAKACKAWGLESSSVADEIQYELNKRFT